MKTLSFTGIVISVLVLVLVFVLCFRMCVHFYATAKGSTSLTGAPRTPPDNISIGIPSNIQNALNAKLTTSGVLSTLGGLPTTSKCSKCGMPFGYKCEQVSEDGGDTWHLVISTGAFAAPHVTYYESGRGVFVLCKKCWRTTSLEEKLAYYQSAFKANWSYEGSNISLEVLEKVVQQESDALHVERPATVRLDRK